ncbi:hypothetical protein UFOVP192_59 [uncultured Caudovirales phage]|uniref:Uncharacterized protein n=1 Tax=uncultured Caudovirales phage TaxID=2100421 RepID=A0A6J7WN28_9CAUD|nr:hypothetical protein UFOVP192_59 [uncultured Caudovirales phage]
MAVVQNKDTCNSCRFFSVGDRMGICKRYPTAVNKSNEDWCGEWELADSVALDLMVQQMTEPVLLSETPKKRGRPSKK